jgi:hypothetical protein
MAFTIFWDGSAAARPPAPGPQRRSLPLQQMGMNCHCVGDNPKYTISYTCKRNGQDDHSTGRPANREQVGHHRPAKFSALRSHPASTSWEAHSRNLGSAWAFACPVWPANSDSIRHPSTAESCTNTWISVTRHYPSPPKKNKKQNKTHNKWCVTSCLWPKLHSKNNAWKAVLRTYWLN